MIPCFSNTEPLGKTLDLPACVLVPCRHKGPAPDRNRSSPSSSRTGCSSAPSSPTDPILSSRRQPGAMQTRTACRRHPLRASRHPNLHHDMHPTTLCSTPPDEAVLAATLCRLQPTRSQLTATQPAALSAAANGSCPGCDGFQLRSAGAAGQRSSTASAPMPASAAPCRWDTCSGRLPGTCFASLQPARTYRLSPAQPELLQSPIWRPPAGVDGQQLTRPLRHIGDHLATIISFLPGVQGRGLADSPPTVGASDEALLGQLEWVEAGVISGWACVRGAPNQVLKVGFWWTLAAQEGRLWGVDGKAAA